jgi:hypothetical protein
MRTNVNQSTVLGFTLGILLLVSLGAVTWTPSGGNYGVVGGVTNAAAMSPVITTTSNTVALAATASTGGPERLRVRTLQNIGTVPVMYAYGSTASTTNLNGVLAPGSAARDGYGSMLYLDTWRGSVSIAVESGTGVVATGEVISGM